MRSLAEIKTKNVLFVYLIIENELKWWKQNKTGRSRNISSFFSMARFCAPPPCAPQCELVSPSVTLAPRGELVIHLSRSHRVASSFHHFTRSHRLASSFRHLSRSHRMASSFSSFFVFFLDRGRFCPFLTEKELLTMWPLLNSRKGSKRSRFHVHNRCQSKQVCRCRCSRSWSRRCLRRRLVV